MKITGGKFCSPDKKEAFFVRCEKRVSEEKNIFTKIIHREKLLREREREEKKWRICYTQL